MKVLKSIFFTTVFILTTNLLTAQETNEVHEKEIKLKIIQEVDGEKIIIDTIISSDDNFDKDEFLKEHNIQLEHFTETVGNKKIITLKLDDESADGNIKKQIYVNATDEVIVKQLKGDSLRWHIEEFEENNLKHVIIQADEAKSGRKVKIVKMSSDGDSITVDCFNEDFIHNGDIHKNFMLTVNGDDDTFTIHEAGEHEAFEYILKNGDGEKKVIIQKIVLKDISLDDLEEVKELKSAGFSVDEPKLEPETFKLYPNPADDNLQLTFYLPEKGDTDISLFSLDGKKIYEEHLKKFSGTFEKQIDVTDATSGIYYLRIVQNEKSFSQKMIIR